MRLVLSVATGPHYRANAERLMGSPYLEDEEVQVWEDELPPGSPSHAECPYGFKIYAIEQAVRMGATSILWLDSSTIVLKPLDDLWKLIELHGVYHHASAKHLGRYVDEFTFRLNEGNVKEHTLARLDAFVDRIRGKRITYARLTA